MLLHARQGRRALHGYDQRGHGFGVFVALDEVYVEGLVHISELGNDYFHFDAAKHELLGERTGKRYRLGDRIPVKLVRVDLDTAKIDFVLDETAKAAR